VSGNMKLRSPGRRTVGRRSRTFYDRSVVGCGAPIQKTFLVNYDQNVSSVDADMTTPKPVFMSAVLIGRRSNVPRGNLFLWLWRNCTNVQSLLSGLSSLLVICLAVRVRLPAETLKANIQYILGAFARLRTTKIISVMFVRPLGTTRLPLDGFS
jgi:hypothetical protein